MVNFDNVTAKNSLLYAMREYDNPQCLDAEEFAEDYKRFKYVKRLCKRYLLSKSLSEQLMLNHLVLLKNVFGSVATVRLLFVKCDDARLYKVLKPFLIFMDILPEVVVGVNGEDIYTNSIPTDEDLLQRLQAL